ncbi:MAG TPA: hypothetical protein VIR01_13665, partial [Pyrinomonadaceae bacterium]
MSIHIVNAILLISSVINPGPIAASETLAQQTVTQKNGQPSQDGSVVKQENTEYSDPLLKLLVDKHLLTTEEARSIASSGDPQGQRDRLAALLKDKGLISADELNSITGSGSPAVAAAPVAIKPAGPVAPNAS